MTVLSTLGLVAGQLSLAEANADLIQDNQDNFDHTNHIQLDNGSAGNPDKIQDGHRTKGRVVANGSHKAPRFQLPLGTVRLDLNLTGDSTDSWTTEPMSPLVVVDAPSYFTARETIHSPTIGETSDHLPPVQQAGIPWVAIVGIGIIELIARRKGNNREGRPVFDVSLLFANHRKVVVGEVVLNADGSLNRTSTGDSAFQGPQEQNLGSAPVTLDSATNRLTVNIPDGGVLEMGIEVNEGASSGEGKTTLTASARNAGYAGDTAPLTLTHEEADSSPPHIINIVNSVSRGVSGTGGSHRNRYEITLNNGDIIFLSVITKHHGRGEYKIESAQLHRFSGDVDDIEDLTVTKGDRGVGGKKTIGLTSETGDIAFDITATMPSGGSGDGATFDEASLKFKTTPPLQYQSVVQKPGSVDAEVASLVRASQASAIIPNSETAYKLLSFWENARSEFIFTGEMGGVTISAEAPLVIRGAIKNGEFVPELDGDNRQSVAVAGRVRNGTDRIQVLDLTLVKTGDDYVLEMRLPRGGKMIIPMHWSGHLFGFGSVETTVLDAVQARSFDKLEIGATSVMTTLTLTMGGDDDEVATAVSDEDAKAVAVTWQTASDEVHQEVSRFMSRISGPWDLADVVTVAEGNPNLIRVLLDDNQELVLRRSLEYGLVRYTVVNDPDSDFGVEGLLAQKSGNPVLGGLAVTHKTATTMSKPWRGTLVQMDETDDEIRYMDLQNGSLEAAYNKNERSLSFYLPRIPKISPQTGYLTSVRQNGHTALVFEMENGSIVNLQAPSEYDETDLLMALAMPEEGDSQAILNQTKLIVLDHRGNTLQETDLSIDDRKVVADLNGVFNVTVLSEKGEIGLRLQKPKVVEAPAPAPSPVKEDGDVQPDQAKEETSAAPVGAVESSGTSTDTEGDGSSPSETGRNEDAGVTESAGTGSATAGTSAATGTEGTGDASGLSPTSGAGTRTDLKDLKDFPYEEGAFALPSRATRNQMRRIFGPNKPHEGETANFEFFGGLHSPDGEHRADVILARMRRFGRDTKSYFDWIISVDMVFRRGRWIPNTDGVLHAERYIDFAAGAPRGRRGGRPEANVFRHEKSGDYPVSLGTNGQLWNLRAGGSNAINPFRVDVTHGRDHFPSPDFALSFGKPTPKAQNNFRDVETATTKADPKAFLPPTATPLRIETGLDTHKVPITPRFGDAIYRRHMDSVDGLQYIEFSPGYSDSVPSRRFSQLRGDDGNGFSWRVIFEHGVQGTSGEGTTVSAVEINGQRIDTNQLNHISKTDGTSVLIGQARVPAIVGGDAPDETIKLAVSYEERTGVLNIRNLSIGNIEVEIQGFHFQPALWDEREIFTPREGRELNVTVTRVMGRPKSGRPKLPQGPVGKPQAIAAYLPDDVKSLSQGAIPMGAPLESRYPDGIIPVTYRLPAAVEGGSESSLGLRLRYNDRLGVYEPVEKPGAISVMIDGQAVDAQLYQTDSGRNWQITLDSGESFYLGNFYTLHGNVADGRTTPVLWSTSGRDPNRRGVVHALSKMGAIEQPRVQELPLNSAPFDLTVSAAGQTYTLPARAVQHPGTNRVLVVPIGPAHQLGDGTTSVVHYYQSRRGDMPEAIEVDGFAFELQVVTKGGRTTPKLVTHRSTPGASSLYTDSRARNSVRLEPEDQSALILLDLAEEQFDTAVQTALAARAETPNESSPVLVRRSLWDAISGNTYEFAYDVVADAHGHPRLAFLGLARITDAGAEVLAVDAHEHRGRLYIRTADNNHYLSHNLYPGLALGVSSHGRAIRRDLLTRPWETVPLRDDIFSRQPVPTPDIQIEDKKYYSHSGNRARARGDVASWAGLEPELFWNWDVEFPNGLQWSYRVTPGNPTFTYQRQGGDFTFEMRFNGHRPSDLVVFFRGRPIPARIHRGIAGRSYIALEGPFSGVLFYVDIHFGIIELSHPALRGQLANDLGFEAMDRHRNRITWSYPDPETESTLQAALDRQVARVRTAQGTQVEIKSVPLDPVKVTTAIETVYGSPVIQTIASDGDVENHLESVSQITSATVRILRSGDGAGEPTGVVRQLATISASAQEKAKQSLTSLEIMAIVLEVTASIVNDPYDASQAEQRMGQITAGMEALIRMREPGVNPLLLRHFSNEELAAIVREILSEK